MAAYTSWGNIPRVTQESYVLPHRHISLPVTEHKSLLPYGKGRSYGDVCLNAENIILPTRYLDKYISFNPETGVLRCEAGVCLHDLLALMVPRGYFVPVTPGTKYVTVGGMIANDVHGKNHHRAGTFGCYVVQFELLRSNGERLLCSPTQNTDYFAATIGGLGLTGLITWAEIQLKPIGSDYISAETIPFTNLSRFMDLTADSDTDWEYTVSWIDSFATKEHTGKGIFFRGNHADSLSAGQASAPRRSHRVPFFFPAWVLNSTVLKLFNRLYFATHKTSHDSVSQDQFFYPLDSLGSWNRIYGKRGFYQYQCVVPPENAEANIKALLQICARANAGSFLSVLKKFGDVASPGMLSFPRPGYTLALDFPNHGKNTRKMLDALDDVVRGAGGAVYPAKDARMSAASFQQYFPRWQEFSAFIDPAFSSSFWRRVTRESV